jgi:hypothetical protein
MENPVVVEPQGAESAALQLSTLERLFADFESRAKVPASSTGPAGGLPPVQAAQALRLRAQLVAMRRLESNGPVSEKLMALIAPPVQEQQNLHVSFLTFCILWSVLRIEVV